MRNLVGHLKDVLSFIGIERWLSLTWVGHAINIK